VCGLAYATVKLHFLRCPCRGYMTSARLQLEVFFIEFRIPSCLNKKWQEDFMMIKKKTIF
jgi:hypothetical protein